MKFTFRQACFNVVTALTIVVGLSLANGVDFNKKAENRAVILVVILASIAALILKLREENREVENEK